MIILRQKNYSQFSETVLNWAKKLTPRIPLSKNSKLYIIWPGTIIGALIGVFMGLAKKYKHSNNKSGEPTTTHGLLEHTPNSLFKEKHFSDVKIESTFEEYCNVIPGYKNLAYLNSVNFSLFETMSSVYKKNLWTYFPSFFVLANPKIISEYRKDYLNSEDPRDYSEILFLYGNELVYVWDFDTKYWYLIDKTYKPSKEWKIGNSKEALKKSLLNVCDPKKDELLKHRIEAVSDPEVSDAMKNYCNILVSLIEDCFKY